MTADSDFDAQMDAFMKRPAILRACPKNLPKYIAIVVAFVLAGWGISAVFGWVTSPNKMIVQLQGPGVEKLEPGELVVMGITRVGEVVNVQPKDGQIVADLQIDSATVEQIPGNSVFKVESLNEWTPGNLGVRVYPPAQGEPTVPLEDGLVFEAPESVLPVGIPKKFYLLVGGAILLLALAVGLASAFKEIILKTIVIGATLLIICGAYLYFAGQISPPAL